MYCSQPVRSWHVVSPFLHDPLPLLRSRPSGLNSKPLWMNCASTPSLQSTLRADTAAKSIETILKTAPEVPRAIYFYDFFEPDNSSFPVHNWILELDDQHGPSERDGRWESFFLKDVGVVRTRKSHPADGGLGHVVWNSARMLSALLLNEDSAMKTNFDGMKVLELGAGAGLMGLSIARKHPEATVELTDYLPCLVENIKEVSEVQRMKNVDAWLLDWKNGLVPGERDNRVLFLVL
eukprot:757623-Hanusia_phi.AAC.4